MTDYTLYDPLINPDPFASGFLGYGQLPLTPIYFIPFPPTSLSDLFQSGAAIFDVDPLPLITGVSGVNLNTSGLAYTISPGYDPFKYLFAGGALPANENGVTLSLTADEGYAGFTNYDINLDIANLTGSLVPVNDSFPVLDAATGFVVTFDLAITDEQSNANRAGFSLTLITDNLTGVELGFKEEGVNSDRIFAQTATFTEGPSSTAPLEISNTVEYQLAVQGNSYTLSADGVEVLSGDLVDYNFNPTASDPPLPSSINPYETPNFLFLGDNTDQGYADFTLGGLSITTLTPANPDSDFNGDGHSDIIWRGPGTGFGQQFVWYLDGNGGLSGGSLFPITIEDPNWVIEGVGDIDGDGKEDDLVWANYATGQVSTWFAEDNGQGQVDVVGGGFLGSGLAPGWQLQGVGDFDGDGYQDDLVCFDPTTSQGQIWYLDNGTVVGTESIAATQSLNTPGWSIGAVSDADGDGRQDDLIWRNQYTGATAVWYMDGSNATGGAILFDVPSNWVLSGASNFDGGSAPDDLLWWDSTTGTTALWYMDGTTYVDGVLGLQPAVPTSLYPVV